MIKTSDKASKHVPTTRVVFFRAKGTKVPAGGVRPGGLFLPKPTQAAQIQGKKPIFKQEKPNKSRLSAHLFTFAYYLNNPYRVSLKRLPVH
jgi:hypothetical protein